jgi:hypothetical protein
MAAVTAGKSGRSSGNSSKSATSRDTVTQRHALLRDAVTQRDVVTGKQIDGIYVCEAISVFVGEVSVLVLPLKASVCSRLLQ